MKGELKVFTEQTDLLLQVLNHQRHDWLNHFQVLLGYLRLGKPEQGEKYLQRITNLVCQESMIARINCPPLAVLFLTFNALHKDLLLEVEVANQTDLSTLVMGSGKFASLVTELISIIKEHQQVSEYEANSLLVSLASTDHAVEVRFDLTGTLFESGNEEVEKLLERGENTQMIVEEWSKTDQEWVLALTVPCRT